MARLHPVRSSSVAAIGYDRRGRKLLVQFRSSDRVYRYVGVPPPVFAALAAAESKGRFINVRIKPRYPCQKS